MAETDWISAAEAARRLGIKQATLYSYVSRGVLTRRRASGGRGSGASGGAGGSGGAGASADGGVPAPMLMTVLTAWPAGRAACSIRGRSRNWPAVAARAGRPAWPGW